MLGIEEITKWQTSDGREFDDDEAAMDHEIELATRKIEPGDLIVKDKFGEIIEVLDLWWDIGGAYYVEVHSETALNFFNEASDAAKLLPLENGLGIYRYDERKNRWATPQEEIQEIWELWSVYNEELKFTIS